MYLGNQPALSYTSFAKQDFTTSETTSYTLDHPVTNENEIALFINFVRQEPGTAYTASNTNLNLTSATSATDDMYCVFLGKAVQTVNPPSGSVGSSQVAASIITGQTALGATPADTDELLISDAGTLKRVDFSHLKSAQTPIFRATVNGTQQVPNATYTKIEFDTEVFDPQSTFDTSNYRFTPAVAGYYFICAKIRSASDNDFGYFGCNIYKNGSEISSANNAHFHFDSVSTSIIDLADDNDYYEVFTYHNEGGGMNYSNGTAAMQFFAYKLIT